jgi:hypothetical protein
MWDWYNRPGRRGVPRTRTVLLIMVVGGLAVGMLFTLLYILIAPLIFVRVPG